MKNVKIKTVKQLPSWFKLENYSKTKSFGTVEWYNELMPRFYIMKNKVEKFVNDVSDSYQRWDLIKKEGLLFYSSRKQNVSHRATLICPQVQVLRKTDEIPAHGELEFASTTSLSNFHAYASYWLLEAPMREEIVENMRELLKDDTSEEVFQPLHGKAAEWGGKPFDDFPSDVVMGLKNKFAYARVNLHASNEQIKKDFALWLAAERKRRNQSTSKKNFNDIDFVSWYESAVLPYLDLTFWATTENVKINQYAIAQAIFTDAYAVGSDVDPLGKLKTTKKKAEYLMNYETIKLLELQITDFANSR